jgi:hypothetical protein
LHGSLFRNVTAPGLHVPADRYGNIINGTIIASFPLDASPARWGDTGIMTFIVNQQGKVHRCNPGADTAAKVAVMTEFKPDEARATPAPP